MVQIERPPQPSTWICCVPCHWLRRSKAVHKALLTFAMLLVTSLLVTSPVLFLITTLPEGEPQRDCAPLDEACIRERDGPEGVCETEACEEASKKIRELMRTGVDPCKDFYEFSCGGFSKNSKSFLPSSSFGNLLGQVENTIEKLLSNESGVVSGPFQKLGMFYESCVDLENKPVDFLPVYRLLNELGGYLSPESPEPMDLTPLITSLLKVNGAPFFDIYVDVDVHDRTKSAIFLELPTKYHLDESEYIESLSTREQQRLRKFESIIQGFIPRNMDRKERSLECDLLLQFCLALDKIYPRNKHQYDWTNVDQRINAAQNVTYLQENFSFVKWRTLLKNALGSGSISSGSISTSGSSTANVYNRDNYPRGFLDDLQLVYVSSPRYFRSLSKLLNRFSKRIVHNGLLVVYAADTLYDIVNVTATKNRSTSCSRLTKNIFSEMVGALYIRQYSPTYIKTTADRVAGLFERIKETIAERILVSSWLDDETRTLALLKLNALEGKFDVWNGFYNETFLQAEMAEINIDPADFFATVLKRFKQIRKPDGNLARRNSTERRPLPYAVTAYYESSSNSIVVPLTLMIAWSWSRDAGPSYATHATLGTVISHEILHAFDSHYHRVPVDSGHGNEHQWLWLTPQAWTRLEARIECVAKLYARSFWRKVKFLGNSVDVQFDWNVTRNENVADIAALQIAHQTWHSLTNGKDRALPGLEALRPSQLFFINVAQIYCSNMTAEAYILSVQLENRAPPHPERVNGMMMNSLAFADAFRCPAGTEMNPLTKCRTW